MGWGARAAPAHRRGGTGGRGRGRGRKRGGGGGTGVEAQEAGGGRRWGGAHERPLRIDEGVRGAGGGERAVAGVELDGVRVGVGRRRGGRENGGRGGSGGRRGGGGGPRGGGGGG